jgi:purine-binding chemotaxis protein CheW
MSAAPIPVAHQYATFSVAGHFLGVDVLEVQEVLRGQSLTRVPLAPPVVEGLINLRGQIVAALDMRRVLGFPSRPDGSAAVSVVVRTAHGAVSLQVDEIEDVIELASESFEAPPPNADAELGRLLSGIHKLDGRLLLVLNVAQALQAGIPGERN